MVARDPSSLSSRCSEDRVDSFQYFRREFGHDVDRFHVLDDLARTTRSCDHGADIRILEAPAESKLPQRTTAVACDRRELAHLGDLRRVDDSFREPFVALELRARPGRNAVVVLSGEQS